jgi:23S rRNA (cytosine1962-C5)-methyltransferase
LTASQPHPIVPLLEDALAPRVALLDPRHEGAVRLFNGFYEGEPNLVVDLYARTLVVFNHAGLPAQAQEAIGAAQAFFLSQLPWVQSVVLKTRHGETLEARRGVLIYGEKPDQRLREHGVWYAIDLLLSQDAGLYLDMRGLRQWALRNLSGKTVLNAFAYTGSLGVAARAGGASRVVHLDRSRKFLNVAKASYTLNGFPIHKPDFQAADFWTQTSRMRRHGERFDCVFLDPPFFSLTPKGRVDLVADSARLINKARPLASPGGYLVVVNNALFVSGSDYIATLERLCAEGYLSIEELIPVPADVTGYPQAIRRSPPADPAPFNHSTKIAVLRMK